MEVAILTVGDEVLAGDIANTNAQWLAARLTDSGATVDRILTIPDDRDRIAATIGEWTTDVDAVIVTGGLGGTHDDVTADALADAFDRKLVVDEAVRQDVIETVAAYRDLDPETVTAAKLDFDVDAWAALPAGCQPLLNPEGLCPGCVLESVYAFPGVPAEMQALFEQVAAEFDGETISRVAYTPQPEGTMTEAIDGVRERFDVTIGSYPTTERHNRLKVTGTDPATVDAALEWLAERIDLVEDE
ncbi:competence/damage-inducible protein A [Natronorubrum sulfidifaciens]|uniref:Molybdopterin binding domain-containing protein n=1 Tax=Natronorubrum sulfidifaciens JCM 14089 TaxID=1230460 RepID=L9W4K8_9EURY|nr:molybdopterin-binding protein [Natronorubrum sulfidifaciens]ELY44399.1 molybdopterin binding domain-containing protein [Natronorubrum sulfidifaciens JCM 14089]